MDFLEIAERDVGLVIATIALATTAITTIIAAIQARRAAQANELYAYLELRGRYHEESMRQAIQLLSGFAWPIKQKQQPHWDELMRQSKYHEVGLLILPHLEALEASAQQHLLQAVRHVASYFEDVGFLLKFKHIEGRACKLSFINVSGLNVYYEMCVPTYVARNKNAVTLQFVAPLRKVLGRHGEGLRVF